MKFRTLAQIKADAAAKNKKNILKSNLKYLPLMLFLAALGVTLGALPLLIQNKKEISDCLTILAAIEIPIVLVALQGEFYRHLSTRYVPLHIGNITRTIHLKGK